MSGVVVLKNAKGPRKTISCCQPLHRMTRLDEMTDPQTKASSTKQPARTSHASLPPSARGSTRPSRPSSSSSIRCTMGANGLLTSYPGVVNPEARLASKASETLDSRYPVVMISDANALLNTTDRRSWPAVSSW
jgi:hypothetical protein